MEPDQARVLRSLSVGICCSPTLGQLVHRPLPVVRSV